LTAALNINVCLV